jgi:hypothetical protein
MRRWHSGEGEGGVALNVVEKRFRKNYHPAWSATFILDPLYLVKDVRRRALLCWSWWGSLMEICILLFDGVPVLLILASSL